MEQNSLVTPRDHIHFTPHLHIKLYCAGYSHSWSAIVFVVYQQFQIVTQAPSSVLSWVYPHNQVVISDGPSNSLVMDETRQSSVSFSWCASRMELALAKLNIWSDGTYVTTGFFGHLLALSQWGCVWRIQRWSSLFDSAGQWLENVLMAE